MANWSSIIGGIANSVKKNPEIWKTGASIAAPLIGSLFKGSGQNAQAAQQNQGSVAADQVGWYGQAIPEIEAMRQSALNAAMGNYDAYGDYERGTKMLGAGDIYRNRGANIAGIKGMQPGWLQGRTGSVWMPTRSDDYINRLSTGALSSLQADKEKNLIEQSQGQFNPSDLTAQWGTSDQTTALQQALAAQRQQASSGWEDKWNKYLTTMQKGYGDLNKWASGKN